eukprot:1179185-Prorocentrum_minimum.AAC.2
MVARSCSMHPISVQHSRPDSAMDANNRHEIRQWLVEKGTPVGVVYRARGPALGSWEDQPPAAYRSAPDARDWMSPRHTTRAMRGRQGPPPPPVDEPFDEDCAPAAPLSPV